MPQYYTLGQGKQTGRTERCKISIFFFVFFGSTFEEAYLTFRVLLMRSIRCTVTSAQPYLHPQLPLPLSLPEVKRKKGNFYENLTQIVFCKVTLNYAKLCNLIIFFASVKGNGWYYFAKRNETKPGEIYNETKGIMQMYFLIR